MTTYADKVAKAGAMQTARDMRSTIRIAARANEEMAECLRISKTVQSGNFGPFFFCPIPTAPYL
jgi:hypothetical protein